MRLGYLVPEFPSQTHAFFWREVSALRGVGQNVTIYSTRKPSAKCAHEFADQAIAETKYIFPSSFIRDLFWGLFQRPLAVFKAMKYCASLRESKIFERLKHAVLILPAIALSRDALSRGIDHIHVHSMANAAHVVAMGAFFAGYTYSLTLHGDLDVYGKNHKSKARSAKFLTCVTKQLKDAIHKAGVKPQGEIFVISMGVDLAKLPKKKVELVKNRPLRLISVARLNINKGHIYALNAVKALKDEGMLITYKIVGDGPEMSRLPALVADMGLKDCVSFSGSLSEGDVVESLMTSDVLLLPSINLGEAAPVAVMEAMACGLTVISSIIGGTPDMITDGEDGFLVKQKDSDGICAALRKIYNCPILLERISEKARTRAEAQFDANVQAIQLLEACTQVKR